MDDGERGTTKDVDAAILPELQPEDLRILHALTR